MRMKFNSRKKKLVGTIKKGLNKYRIKFFFYSSSSSPVYSQIIIILQIKAIIYIYIFLIHLFQKNNRQRRINLKNVCVYITKL